MQNQFNVFQDDMDWHFFMTSREKEIDSLAEKNVTSISSQLASAGIIFPTAWASKPMVACNSYARCCKSVEWDADSSSIKD